MGERKGPQGIGQYVRRVHRVNGAQAERCYGEIRVREDGRRYLRLNSAVGLPLIQPRPRA